MPDGKGYDPQQGMQIHQFRAMNTTILLSAQGGDGRLSAAFDRVEGYVQACERRFTRFSGQSELAQLNAAAGRWFPASPEMFEVVQMAWHYVDLTGGLFNPAVLQALERVGYDRSMDEIRVNGAARVTPGNKVQVLDFHAVRFDEAGRGIWLPPGMQIDLGGIAKGWIAQRAALLLAEYAQTCAVNAGGDMFLVGLPQGEHTWQVALEDTRDPSRSLAILGVGPGAIATSSTTRRRWQQGNQLRHHLIDPRTGEPAETEWLSVTVIAPQAATAEVFAKALLIIGPQGAQSLARRAGDLEFIAVDTGGQLWGSQNSREYLNVSNGLLSR